MGESLFYLLCYSSFNGEGCNVLSKLTFPPRRVPILILVLIVIATKCGFEFDPFSLKKYRVDFLSSLAFLFKKSGKRAASSGHTNLTLFQKIDKTERKLGRYVKDVFERMYFRRGGGGGGRLKGHFLR